jgi:glycosyltransferase involved in cell wall biosynthesis
MKILHVISSMNPEIGGPGQGIRNFEHGLKGKDTTREIVCFNSQESVDSWENFGLKIYGLGDSSSAWQYNAKFSQWIEHNLANYDVIIINGLWLYHSYAMVKALKRFELKHNKRPRVFIMPHGMLDPWFQKADTRKLKAIRNEIYWWLIEKNVVNYVDGLLFTCEEEIRMAKGTFNGYKPRKEINISYGIQAPPILSKNTIVEFKQKNNIPDKYWLFLSRIHEKKGVDLLLSAYKQLLSEGINLPELLIVGPGIESTYWKEISKMINASEALLSKVHLMGMLQGDLKWSAIYGCETFILPSHQENFGIAVAEALACSKPVLISNQVNIWKEIKRAESGLICEVNVNSIVEMLRTFFELDDETKEKMKTQARYTFETHFDVNKTAQRFVDAISQV